MRLAKSLDKKKFHVDVLDCSPTGDRKGENVFAASPFKFPFPRNRKFDLVHMNLSGAKLKILYSLGAKVSGAKLVLSIHGSVKPTGWRKISERVACSLADEVWVNNDRIASSVQKEYSLPPGRVVVMEHFIRPTPDEMDDSVVDERFRRFAENHTPLIMSTAWRLTSFEGKDLYGFDKCVELTRELRRKYPRLGLVLFIGRNDDMRRYNELLDLVRKADIVDDVLILDGDRRSVPYLKYVNLFLRCTLTDSLGVSVLESLGAGVPVIASDVCPRPKGCTVYEAGNVSDLISKSLACLEGGGRKADPPAVEDSLDFVTSRYENLHLAP